MFKSCLANFYLRVPNSELIANLSPEYKGHLRSIFNDSDLQKVKLEFGSNSEVILHYQGEK